MLTWWWGCGESPGWVLLALAALVPAKPHIRDMLKQLRWLLLLAVTFWGLGIHGAASAKRSDVNGSSPRALAAVSLALSSPDSENREAPVSFSHRWLIGRGDDVVWMPGQGARGSCVFDQAGIRKRRCLGS